MPSVAMVIVVESNVVRAREGGFGFLARRSFFPFKALVIHIHIRYASDKRSRHLLHHVAARLATTDHRPSSLGGAMVNSIVSLSPSAAVHGTQRE
eukprot:scaffold25149_cov78-Skeletonema_dohrnii-CCMP3373.AAC.1